jgi:hypothetical protein
LRSALGDAPPPPIQEPGEEITGHQQHERTKNHLKEELRGIGGRSGGAPDEADHDDSDPHDGRDACCPNDFPRFHLAAPLVDLVDLMDRGDPP